MLLKRFNFEVLQGTTEGITYSGQRKRRSTVLIRLGSRSISRQALLLGAILTVLQVFDALLTYIGLSLHGIHLEGNSILADVMLSYGLFPALVVTKLIAVFLIVVLTLFSHRRKWIRPFIIMLCATYITLAIVPWVFILSSTHANQKTVSGVHKNV